MSATEPIPPPSRFDASGVDYLVAGVSVALLSAFGTTALLAWPARAPLKVRRRLEGGGSVRPTRLKAKLEAGQRVEGARRLDCDRLPTGPSRHSIAGLIVANHARP
jgi:hypothetical protein